LAPLILGELLGCILGLVVAPRHLPSRSDLYYERPTSRRATDSDIAFPLLGGVAGALVGVAAALGYRGVRSLWPHRAE
jgi:hypothetical protein